MNPRLFAVLAVLAFLAAEPRIALLAAAVATAGTLAAVRLLLARWTVYAPRRARWS
jgi:hypothetical protein